MFSTDVSSLHCHLPHVLLHASPSFWLYAASSAMAVIRAADRHLQFAPCLEPLPSSLNCIPRRLSSEVVLEVLLWGIDSVVLAFAFEACYIGFRLLLQAF